MPTSTRRTPQDRKPTTTGTPGEHSLTGGVFSFVGPDGASHTLPPAADALNRLDFGEFLDLADAGESGQVTLALRALAAADLDPATSTALRGLTMRQGAAVLGAWFTATNEDGVTVPQS